MKDVFRGEINRLCRRGVDYADIRHVRRRTQHIRIKNGQVEVLSDGEDEGFGTRVLKDGAWGFAASPAISDREVARAGDQAIELASASALALREKVKLSPTEPHIQRHSTIYRIDPFEVPLDEKIQQLSQAVEVLRREDMIVVAEGYMRFFRTWKQFFSTEGSEIEQEITESGGGLVVTASDGSQVQRRSYPDSHGGGFAARGYEFISKLELVEHAERIRDEAIQLLAAPDCPERQTTLIIGGPQLALQVHESCGHPIELDRVLGSEISLAGASFLTTDKLNTFRYGSNAVTITADATVEGSVGSFGFDDEGVEAQRVPIVQKGRFVGYLTSRETASVIGQRSNGAMRADGWSRIPLIRMTNINLEPGQGSLEELLADTREGVFVDINKSWSIDDRRLNFQFGTELAWEIKRGRRVRMFKNAVYTGLTPEFWSSCDAICGPEEWRVWGLINCGKGEPHQTAHVGHGTAPARFRNVTIGVRR